MQELKSAFPSHTACDGGTQILENHEGDEGGQDRDIITRFSCASGRLKMKKVIKSLQSNELGGHRDWLKPIVQDSITWKLN